MNHPSIDPQPDRMDDRPETSSNVPRCAAGRSRRLSITAAALLALSFASATFAHPAPHTTGEVPLTDAAAAAIVADLNAGILLPENFICEVDGTLVSVIHDADPVTSGVSGILVVNGMPILVPAAVPIQIGDTPGDNTAFTNLTAEPAGHPSFLGMGASVAGHLRLMPDTGSGAHLLCTADFVLIEVGHPPLVGVVTANGPGGLFVNGVPIELHTDPRIAPFIRITDLAGRPLEIADLPEGAPIVVHGDYDGGTGSIVALTIILETIIPPAPGETDHISILRAEARSARPELRVRGFTNNLTTTISLYDHSAGSQGILLASGVVVGPDGRWDFRGDVPRVVTTPTGIVSEVLARTTNGGEALGPVSVK